MSQVSKRSQALLWGVVVPVVLVGIGIGAVVVMGKQQPKKTAIESKDTIAKLRKLPIVSVSQVESTASLKSLDVSVSGSVVPFRQINLAVEVAGRIRMKSENCQIGRLVKQGEILFELDPKDLELEVERLEAARQSELAQQSELEQDIANSKKSLMLADEELALLDKELQRLGSIAKGFASDTELDQARRQRVTSASQRLSIQNQLETFETRRARLRSAERLVMAQLEQAKVNLERTKIAAPIDGVIVTESVQTDSFVQKGATLCVIEDIQCVEVSCNLRTDQLLLVLQQPTQDGSKTSSRYELPSTPVTVSYLVSGREDIRYEWQGQLSRYEGIGLDSQSRTTPVRIRVDKPQEVYQNGVRIYEKTGAGLPALVRGMFVECSIHTQPPAATVLVPKLGLKPGNQIWKFVSDNSIVASEEVSATEQPTASVNSNATTPKDAQVTIQPEQWTAGRLQVIPNAKVINLIPFGSKQEEYWVIESKDLLSSGDLVIVSPLANVVGDGQDEVRYQSDVPQMSDEGSATPRSKE